MSGAPTLSIFVCDPSPYSSFEEQWGAQLGEQQARLANQDAAEDEDESIRCEFIDQLGDPDFESDLEHEGNMARYTETQEPEEFAP